MSTWRAKSRIFRISRRTRLKITVRRFHTPKHRRAKRQIIITPDFCGIREIAFKFERSAKRRKRQQTATAAPGFWQLHVSLPTVFIMAGILGIGVCGLQLSTVQALEPVAAFSGPPVTGLASKAMPYSTPTHISIPSVGIDVAIVPVGQNSDGSIAMPPLFAWEAGWYRYSPTPGQVGPAVIVGHVDTYKGISVFWRLRDVHRGDLVHIKRADGTTATFKITTLEQYDQAGFPTQTVYGNIKYPGLRLITCGGSFDEATHHYTQNTVVSGFLVTQ